MKRLRRACCSAKCSAGFSLLELVIVGAIGSVGTLAVFTLYLHLSALPVHIEQVYQHLEETTFERPQPAYGSRFEPYACEYTGT